MSVPSTPIRILLLADSHLGFDLPTSPRVERRRRGHDFLANHERALAPAKVGKVDLVIHGGDVFHRPRASPSLVFQAFRSLLQVAENGVPVFVVPGNHERSRIPHARFTRHPNLHVFLRPATVAVETRQGRVAIAGFPYERRGIRKRFPQALEETGWRRKDVGLRLLCMHHCVEGATVGPSDYTFRHAPDVVRCSDLPEDFAAILSGHIHRHQVLLRDLQGRPLPTPVFYPGSLERTAFAETGEEKGFMFLEGSPGAGGGEIQRHEFVRLPARPMLVRDLHPRAGSGAEWSCGDLRDQLSATLAGVPQDAVLRIRLHGRVPPEGRAIVAANRLRGVAPAKMNLEVTLAQDRAARQGDDRGRHRHLTPEASNGAEGPASHPQLRLPF